MTDPLPPFDETVPVSDEELAMALAGLRAARSIGGGWLAPDVAGLLLRAVAEVARRREAEARAIGALLSGRGKA